jgi:hypothetical protein
MQSVVQLCTAMPGFALLLCPFMWECAECGNAQNGKPATMRTTNWQANDVHKCREIQNVRPIAHTASSSDLIKHINSAILCWGRPLMCRMCGWFTAHCTVLACHVRLQECPKPVPQLPPIDDEALPRDGHRPWVQAADAAPIQQPSRMCFSPPDVHSMPCAHAAAQRCAAEARQHEPSEGQHPGSQQGVPLSVASCLRAQLHAGAPKHHQSWGLWQSLLCGVKPTCSLLWPTCLIAHLGLMRLGLITVCHGDRGHVSGRLVCSVQHAVHSFRCAGKQAVDAAGAALDEPQCSCGTCQRG